MKWWFLWQTVNGIGCVLAGIYGVAQNSSIGFVFIMVGSVLLAIAYWDATENRWST